MKEYKFYGWQTADVPAVFDYGFSGTGYFWWIGIWNPKKWW